MTTNENQESQPLDMDQVIEYLRENLRLNHRVESNYTGGMDDSGSLYSKSHEIDLALDGEVISSISL